VSVREGRGTREPYLLVDDPLDHALERGGLEASLAVFLAVDGALDLVVVLYLVAVAFVSRALAAPLLVGLLVLVAELGELVVYAAALGQVRGLGRREG
jgi:hypothetical protein